VNNLFLYADYSQIELRCAAHLSQDPLMLQAYRDSKDLHLQTAKALYNDPLLTKKDENKRQTAKTTNFLLIYNGSANRLQAQLWEEASIKVTYEEATKFRRNFFGLYPRYEKYLKEQKEFLKKYKIAISPFGRLRRLPDLKYYEGLNYEKQEYKGIYKEELEFILQNIPVKERFTKDFKTGNKKALTIFDIAKRKVGHAFNQGYNFPIQSMAASIIKRAMIVLNCQGYDIVNNIHDSVYIQLNENEIDKHKDNVRQILENIVKLTVPLVVDMKVLRSFSSNDII
jgi:DNA polymerase I-like protein with 3'-5' exonuclease and polymerase domains